MSPAAAPLPPPPPPARPAGAPSALSALESAWAASDALLTDEVGAARALWTPVSLRRPFVFYLGHLPAFARNTLRRAGAPLAHHAWDALFERGIDPDVEDNAIVNRHHAPPPAWPAWRDVVRFRDAARALVRDRAPGVPPHVLTLVAEHEAMHVETLYYMLAQGASDSDADAANAVADADADAAGGGAPVAPVAPVAPDKVAWVRVAGGDAAVGRARGGAFGWDNEFPGKRVGVGAFDVAAAPVTVGEFVAFVEGGGYQRAEHWAADDWAWVAREGVAHPASLRRAGGGWAVATVDGLAAAAGDVLRWPVYVSLAEARAYARAQGARLLGEAEWDRVAFGEGAPWGEGRPVGGVHGNFGMGERRPVPGGGFPEGNVGGVEDLFGNGWELVDDVFEPVDGFEPMPLYEEYSADFFDGKHFVLKGASWATDDMLVRRSFRNFYQAHYPYVFSKFRLAKDVV